MLAYSVTIRSLLTLLKSNLTLFKRFFSQTEIKNQGIKNVSYEKFLKHNFNICLIKHHLCFQASEILRLATSIVTNMIL